MFSLFPSFPPLTGHRVCLVLSPWSFPILHVAVCYSLCSTFPLSPQSVMSQTCDSNMLLHVSATTTSWFPFYFDSLLSRAQCFCFLPVSFCPSCVSLLFSIPLLLPCVFKPCLFLCPWSCCTAHVAVCLPVPLSFCHSVIKLPS